MSPGLALPAVLRAPSPRHRPYAGHVSTGDTIDLVFDGDCGLCRASVEWLRHRDKDRRINAFPSSSCTWDDVDPALFLSTVVARRDTDIVTASTAAGTALSVLPGGWGALGRLMVRANQTPLFKRVADGCYYLVARHRIAISKVLVRCHLIDASCAVPSSS